MAAATAIEPKLPSSTTAASNSAPAALADGIEPELSEARWAPLLGLPCRMTVDVPVPHFTVSQLLRLRGGSVIATEWRVSREVALRVNGAVIAWGEFEVVGRRLAVRLTELA